MAMANQVVVDSMDVNISREMHRDDYVSVIKQLRTRLAETTTRNRFVLRRSIPDETKGIVAFRRDVRWFDIVLKLSEEGKPQQLVVRLRFRSDNLYLYGYQVNNVWFELRKTGNNTWFIAEGSQALGYDHSYTSILHAAGVLMDKIKLGREELVNAAKALAGQDVQKRAQALVTVIFMFAEASRLEEVLGYVKKGFIESEPPRIKNWMNSQVSMWGQLSYQVLRADQFPKCKWVPKDILTETGPVTLCKIEDVLEYVALLQRESATHSPCHQG